MKYKINPRLFNENSDELVGKYVAQFNAFGRKSAEGVIGMGQTVLEAKEKLEDENEFRRFCNRIRFENGSSAIRKLIQIGKKADLLYKHLERLPSSWTTLYQMSQLTEEQLEDGLARHLIDHTTSGERAKRMVAELRGLPLRQKTRPPMQPVQQSANDTRIDGYSLTIRFGMTPSASEAAMIEQAIRDILAHELFDGQVTRSAALDDLLLADESVLPLAA
jgi:hypothetical protein